MIAVVGLPFGLGVEILHVLGIEDWRWLLVALGAAAGVSAAILSSAPGRSLLRRWLSLRRCPRRGR